MVKKALLIFGCILTILGIMLLISQLVISIIADYNYDNKILFNWNLADKSSTLDAKASYISEFINSLEKAKLSEYNAIFLKTPDNNIKNNLNAVKTLRDRLNEIKGLDPESFAYQTAIQQITQQEQGEADKMLSILKGGWILENYTLVWDWLAALFALICVVISSIGIFLIYKSMVYY